MGSAAPRIPPHGGTESAPEVHHKRGRPTAARDWTEKRPASRPEGWGECPHGQEVSRAGRSSLSARSARLTSCPHRCPQTSTSQLKKRVGKKSNRVIKLCRGGDTGAATRPTGGESRCRAIEAGVGFLPDLPPPPAKASAGALKRALRHEKSTRCFAQHQRLATWFRCLHPGYCRCVELTGFSDSAISTLLLDDNRYAGDLN